jgi:hypothetical protein
MIVFLRDSLLTWGAKSRKLCCLKEVAYWWRVGRGGLSRDGMEWMERDKASVGRAGGLVRIHAGDDMTRSIRLWVTAGDKWVGRGCVAETKRCEERARAIAIATASTRCGERNLAPTCPPYTPSLFYGPPLKLLPHYTRIMGNCR